MIRSSGHPDPWYAERMQEPGQGGLVVQAVGDVGQEEKSKIKYISVINVFNT